MSLSVEQLNLLKRPFRFAEHTFKPPYGFIYVAEAAVTARIEEVDPGWEVRLLNVFTRERTTHALVSMTIMGTTRDGIGTQVIETTKDGDREANESEKAAATDALRRAARLFGIGRYLLECPTKVAVDKYGNVTDRNALDRFAMWLAEQQRAAGMLPPKESQVQEDVPLALNAPDQGKTSEEIFNSFPVSRPEVRGKKWSQAEQVAWWELCNGQEGNSKSDLLAALQVDGLNKFAGSKESADEQLAWYINSKLS